MRPIQTFFINNKDIFDSQIDALEILEEMQVDQFSVLGVNDPILIMNPCEIAQPEFLDNVNDNPYTDEEVDYRM